MPSSSISQITNNTEPISFILLCELCVQICSQFFYRIFCLFLTDLQEIFEKCILTLCLLCANSFSQFVFTLFMMSSHKYMLLF